MFMHLDKNIVHFSPSKERELTELLEEYDAKPDSDSPEYRSLLENLRCNHVLNDIREVARTSYGRINFSGLDTEALTEKALVRVPAIDQRLKVELLTAELHGKLKLNEQSRLPVHNKRHEIISAIANNPITLISGETGCGKTTQIPQYILDNEIKAGRGSMCRIACTQPRRLNAVSVAERVADERGEKLGHENTSVGYQIRFDKNTSREEGSIVYCTTGVVLNWLKDNPLLYGYSHFILDEVHERDIYIDTLMLVLKEIIRIRPELRLILMSATLKAETFKTYFQCIHLKIPGKMYPVETKYLEDLLDETGYARKFPRNRFSQERREPSYRDRLRKYLEQSEYSQDTIKYLQHPDGEELDKQFIITLLEMIHKEPNPGAVLIFVPGRGDIEYLVDRIEDSCKLRDVEAFPLHADISMEEQRAIFGPVPHGHRKVVVSTCLAETAITVPDVVFVIDSGIAKVRVYNPATDQDKLVTQWEAVTNAKQRMGRAGRVQPGICYKLYTRPREETFEDSPTPEMIRVRLEDTIVTMKSIGLGKIDSFFNAVMTPPDRKYIESAKTGLIDMNALDSKNEQLTLFGYNLSKIPVDIEFARVILSGLTLGCLDPALSVVSILDWKDPFYMPRCRGKHERERKKRELHEARKRFARGSRSDLIMFYNMQTEWFEVYKQSEEDPSILARFEKTNFLKREVLEYSFHMKQQIAEQLKKNGFIPEATWLDANANVHSEDLDVLRATLCAAFYPNVVHKSSVTSESTKIHIKSVNTSGSFGKDSWLVYYKLLGTPSPNLFDTTIVPAMPLLLFSRCFKVGKALHTSGDRQYKQVALSDTDRLSIKINVDVEIIEQLEKLREIVRKLQEQCLASPACLTWQEDTKEAIARNVIALAVATE